MDILRVWIPYPVEWFILFSWTVEMNGLVFNIIKYYFFLWIFQSIWLYILQPFQTFNFPLIFFFPFWFDGLWTRSHHKTEVALCHLKIHCWLREPIKKSFNQSKRRLPIEAIHWLVTIDTLHGWYFVDPSQWDASIN